MRRKSGYKLAGKRINIDVENMQQRTKTEVKAVL